MIEVEDLTKFYGDFPALRGVSFRVERGEILGFLGPNGAGKTTTMRILTGFMPPTSGRVRIAGYDVFEESLDARRHIGYLPENVPLYPEMTVVSYLRFVAAVRRVPNPKDAVERIMERLNLDDHADVIIGKLSKGYRQRVGLAQALIHDPEVIILDEPTIGLDPKQIIEVRELIRGLGGEHTIILSTHILPEVSQVCHRVLIINEGEIVAEDTPEGLTARLKGGERIFIHVADEANGLTEVLDSIDGVQEVTHVSDGKYEVTCTLGRELRPVIARALIENGWELLELRPIAMSLEEVFLKLTTE
ncbi:MAG TPA: ATP-binding cassette domain-containing protein [Caldilineae bacterium]|nr:ATP-binding cassette domain-containing protein [Caldilineae bacterium]